MSIWQRQKLMFDNRETDIIKKSVVLIAGVGGLGTHQALELQRIGVKKIYLFDPDKIEESNLNRQIFYGFDDIGEYKALKAKEVLEGFKLGTEIVARREEIKENTEIPDDVDIIFDALDNMESRYYLEELAAEKNLPLIHGGINSWYGQVTTIIPGRTRSLRDIFGDNLLVNGEIPSLSPAVATVASLQVIEGIKVILNKKNLLTDKLLIVDLMDNSLQLIDCS